MIIGLGLSFLVSTTLGVLSLQLLWPDDQAACPRPLAWALGAGLGTGLSGCLLFLWMVAFGPTRAFPLAEAGLLVLVTAATLRRRRAAATAPTIGGIEAGDGSRFLRLLRPAFLVTLGAAVAAFGSLLRRYPHGEWDAWMNWDLRARMIFRGGEAWKTAFSPAIPWSHPDYPMLVPLLVVRSWLYGGTETLLGPALVAAIFTFGTVALLVTALAALRHPSQGLLAGIVLVSTPFFIRHGTSLYADVPLGFFFLAAVVGLALDDRHGGSTRRFAVLAGFATGLAMFTKNEGLLFAMAVAGAFLATSVRDGWATVRGRLTAFGLGLAPLLPLLIGFKIALAPPNDLLSTLGVQHTLGNLTAVDRYTITLRAYAEHLVSFGDNGLGGVVWPLAVCLAGFGVSRPELRRGWARVVAIALVLLFAGHFMVFVSMAHELSRLLASSLDRLILQVWPAALFWFFMVVGTPEKTDASPEAIERSVPGSAAIGRG